VDSEDRKSDERKLPVRKQPGNSPAPQTSSK